jgi:hypothetical protein
MEPNKKRCYAIRRDGVSKRKGREEKNTEGRGEKR